MTLNDHLHPAIGQIGRAVSSTTDALFAVVAVSVERIELILQVRKERRELSRLDERLLKDIGLDHGSAYREYARNWDDVPRKRG